MINENLIMNILQQNQGRGIPVLKQDGTSVDAVNPGDKFKEGFFDVRLQNKIIFDRTIEFIGGDAFKDAQGNEIRTFCGFLVKVDENN